MPKPKILVITPVSHIEGVGKQLEDIGEVTYLDDPDPDEVRKIIANYEAIFTNPNKSKVFLGKEVLSDTPKLKVICTASTGTNHVDKPYINNKGISLLALTEERDVINNITSTAEHALALTLSIIRNIKVSSLSVSQGLWDYTPFVGRQMNSLNVGVIGYGRLGSLYAKYCNSLGSDVFIYDPFKKVPKEYSQLSDLPDIFKVSDIISLHVHVNEETIGMINKKLLSMAKKDLVLINTSRGDIVNEKDLVEFLMKNKKSLYATDVLENEISNRTGSPIYKYHQDSQQVLITPHIGGMTKEAQEIAYNHAASMLCNFFKAE
jgi:D-3-phosphoglycerate dehydrogenase